jgi:hypothetical protein
MLRGVSKALGPCWCHCAVEEQRTYIPRSSRNRCKATLHIPLSRLVPATTVACNYQQPQIPPLAQRTVPDRHDGYECCVTARCFIVVVVAVVLLECLLLLLPSVPYLSLQIVLFIVRFNGRAYTRVNNSQ